MSGTCRAYCDFCTSLLSPAVISLGKTPGAIELTVLAELAFDAYTHLNKTFRTSDLQTILLDLVCKHLRKVDSGCLKCYVRSKYISDVTSITDLAGIVLWMMLHRLDFSRHRRDVKHHTRPTLGLFSRLLKEWQETGCHKVDLGNIRPVYIIPVLESGVLSLKHVLLHLLGAGRLRLESFGRDARIVDQNVQMRFLLRELIVELGDIVFFAHVGNDGNDLTGDALSVCLCHSFELLFGTSYDVDFGAIDLRESAV